MKVKIFKIRLDAGFLAADQDKLDTFLADHQVIKFESAFVNNEEYWSVIVYYETGGILVKESKSEKYAAEPTDLSSDEYKILECLKLWRTEKSREEKIPAYFIATNKELWSIAKYKPVKKEELKDIKGFGRHKIENYGEEIIEILENA